MWLVGGRKLRTHLPLFTICNFSRNNKANLFLHEHSECVTSLQTCNTALETLDTRNSVEPNKYQAESVAFSVASKSYSQAARSKESLLSMLCKQRGQCLLHWIGRGSEVCQQQLSQSRSLAPFRMPTPIRPACLPRFI